MKKYTADGREVSVVKKLEEGFLVKEIYWNHDEDGEDEILSETTVYHESLFDTPPTEKYAAVVEELKKEAEELDGKISALQLAKSSEESTLNIISRFPIIEQLANYVTGNFTVRLDIDDLSVRDKGSVYNSPYVSMAFIESNEMAYLYKNRNSNYTSSEDTPFLVFKDLKELNIVAKNILLKRIKKADYNYNKSNNLKELFRKISHQCQAKTDPEVIAAYEAKLNKFLDEEKIEQTAQLKKKIAELEEAKKKMEALTPTA